MKACVIGVGNIGLRYVQGIASTIPDAQLYLVDRAARLQALEEMDLGKVTLTSSLDDVDVDIDLFVVATSCEPRLAVYKQCLARNPKYVILEKYLFASRDEFAQALALVRVPTFVNQWMYGSKTFDCLFEKPATSVELRGSGWGLACNAVHWIDVFKRHLGIDHLEVASGTTVTDVFASKRADYEEISGTLVFADRHSDKTITLIDNPSASAAAGMTIRVDAKTYVFDYTQILHDDVVLSRFPYFSEQVGGIVDDIMHTGSCTLPDLEESVAQHLLIEDVLDTLDRRPRVT